MAESQKHVSISNGFELARMVIQAVSKNIGKHPSPAIMEKLMRKQALLDQAVGKAFAEIYGVINDDPWADQKAKISYFYNQVFDIDIDWSSIKLPAHTPERPRLELILSEVSGNRMIAAYRKLFGDNAVYSNDFSKDIDAKTASQQNRLVNGPYCFAWTGAVEPDTEHRNKSYDDFCNDGNKYMIPREGIMAALRYRFETGNMLDVKGLTRFHALDSVRGVLFMLRNVDGRFFLGWNYRGFRFAGIGPRQILL